MNTYPNFTGYAPTNWGGYTFVRKFHDDGRITRWYQVLVLLNERGPLTKKQILNAIWPDRHRDYKKADRGYCISMFNQMHRENLIEYDTATRLWCLTGMAARQYFNECTID